MFCKHCGKNIYDLEKCPFCGDGEKLESQTADEPKAADESKTDEKVRESLEVSQGATDTKQKEEKAVESEKKAESFEVRLKRESKGYKVLSVLKSVAFGFQIGIPVLWFIKNWLDNRGSKFQYVLFKTLYDVALVEVWLMFLGLAFGIALTIVYVNASKKKNATDNELAAAFDGLSFESTSLFNPLHALSFRYDRSLFVISVFQTIFAISDMLILAFAARMLVPLCASALKTYGIFTVGFRQEFNIAMADYRMVGLAIAVIFVFTEITTWILRMVRNSKIKALTSRIETNSPIG